VQAAEAGWQVSRCSNTAAARTEIL